MGTKSAEAYLVLKKKLQCGEFEPGQRLTEAKVARVLGFGRAPVREALLKLESEGLIGAGGAYGSRYVRFAEDYSLDEIMQHFELREVIEGFAARLAALNMTGRQVLELRDIVERYAAEYESGDREARYETGRRFHEFLMTNCGNDLLLAVWKGYFLAPFKPKFPVTEERMFAKITGTPDKGRELIPIVDAIASHDADNAERVMRKHIRRSREGFREAMLDASEEG